MSQRCESPASERNLRLARNVTRGIVWLIVTMAIIRMAWIGDDALITLRTILNMTHGWGPGFNPDESVAAYTHPLWFLLWALSGSMLPSWIGANFLISVVSASAAVALIAWSARTIPVIIISGIALLASSAFIDYATSGLENPLSYLLIGLVILQYRALQIQMNAPRAALLGVTVAAVLLTRLDLAVILAPALIFLLWNWRGRVAAIGGFGAGFLLPMMAWQLWFSTTYAALLPNTFAAKTNAEIPRLDLITQGFRYLGISFSYDIGSLLVLIATMVVVVIAGQRWQRLFTLGVVLYLAYVVWVGGDFMVGRFLAVPVFVMVLLSCIVSAEPSNATLGKTWTPAALTGTSLALLVILAVSPLATPTALMRNPEQKWSGSFGIVDERGVYAELGRSLHAWLLAEPTPDSQPPFSPVGTANPWESLALYDRAAGNWPSRNGADTDYPRAVGVTCWLGGASLMTGPNVHWVDTCALADRFLASMPYQGSDWRIGHLNRDIPNGYLDALATGNPDLIKDLETRQSLKDLWNRIRVQNDG